MKGTIFTKEDIVEITIQATNVDGIDYFTVQQFAVLNGKGLSQVYGLLHKKMIKSVVKLNKTLIPVSEMEKAKKLFGKSSFRYTGSHYA